MGDHDQFDAAGRLNWWSTPRTSNGTTSTTGGFEPSSSTSWSAPIIPDGSIDSSSALQIPGFPIDWNQSLLRSSTGGRVPAEPSFPAMLQEPLSYHRRHHDQRQLHQIGGQDMMLQGLLEPSELKPQPQTIFDQRFPSYEALGNSTNYHGSSSDLLAKFPQSLNSSSPPKQQVSRADSLQFSNSTAFWNATVSAGSCPSTVPVQFDSCQGYEQNKASGTGTTTKTNFDNPQKKSSGGTSSSSSKSASKKTRIETPSPLPTFKVRRVKLGDRITALQQLVSPFGKTDTASVLDEAIKYIKILHDQVNVLTSPYMKNGHPMQHQQGSESKQDLRSKGLCLVPIESTYHMAGETTVDFWTRTFGGTF